MSGMGLVASVAVAALCLWGIAIGLRGAFAEAPPYMEGQGKTGRFDTRLRKSA